MRAIVVLVMLAIMVGGAGCFAGGNVTTNDAPTMAQRVDMHLRHDFGPGTAETLRFEVPANAGMSRAVVYFTGCFSSSGAEIVIRSPSGEEWLRTQLGSGSVGASLASTASCQEQVRVGTPAAGAWTASFRGDGLATEGHVDWTS